MDNKTGKFILSLRQEKGLSQYQLAEMIPISRQAVSKWERGENIPDSYTLLKLSEIFNVSINELLIGERSSENSIESLEETVLNILDQSNQKSRKIKRMIITFTTIITVLLLSFLSYYFINSYNSIKVYLIGADNNETVMRSGIFITTKEKYYLKFGELYSNKDRSISNIQFSYIKNGKEKIIAEDTNVDNLNILDNYGYSEKFKDVNEVMENSYLKIKYSDNEEEILKLRFKRDFINGNLFFKKNKNWKKISTNKNEKIAQAVESIEETEKVEVQKEEDNNEETQEEVKQETNKDKNKEKNKETSKKEDTKPVVKEEKQPVVNEEETIIEEITMAKIIDKIKEKGEYSDEGYYYEVNDNGNTVAYSFDEKANQIMMFDSFGDYWDYQGKIDRYTCIDIFDNNLCENHIYENAKKYLFN